MITEYRRIQRNNV